MTGLNDIYGGDFLKAEHLKQTGWPATYTIKNTEIVSYDDGKKQIALHFHETDKKLGLNKTNANRIALTLGTEDWQHGWINHPITLMLEWVEFQGKTVEAIRVPMPAMQPQAQPQQQAAAPQQNYQQPPPSFESQLPPQPEDSYPGFDQ
jgi:hypothetical protein